MFEHFAINVEKPKEMAEWYVKNLHMEIRKSMTESPFTHFLGDDTGRLVMEIYANENAEIPDYEDQHPLRFHIAFASDDAEKMKNELLTAGAILFEEERGDDGSHLVMLRDPFGIPLQICQRTNSFALNKEKVKKMAEGL